MKEFKVGDKVRFVKSPHYVESDLCFLGKTGVITEIVDDDEYPYRTSLDYITIFAADELEKVEPQLLKKGTRVKILVDREDIMFNGKITCHTGVIEAEGPELYGVRADNGDYYGVKHSDVEEIREEYFGCTSAPLSGTFSETGFEWAYRGIDSPTHILDATRYGYWSGTIKNSPKKGGKNSIMSELKKATNFIRSLKQPLKNYVRLGWVELIEDEYVVTDNGVAYYMDVVFGLTPAKTLEEYAEKEVARIKKEEEGESE